MPVIPWQRRRALSAPRNTQLDGWRAFAVLGVIWLHWTPREWRGALPFEIGLYFFLILTGFLTTRVLLRDRDAGEKLRKPWKRMAFRHFLKRRAVRLLLPCYAAMLLGWLCGSPDLSAHPLIYLTHVANIHMAFSPSWPPGTAHYWTLAIQIQFFLLWPLVILYLPRKALLPALIAFTLLAPLTRWAALNYFPQVYHAGALSTSAADYLGMGSLLALAMERGMPAGDRRLRLAAWLAFAGYLVLYVFDESGHPVTGLRHVQQTLLSMAFVGLISATLRGFSGALAKTLEHPVAQHIGRISYGLYLFHTIVPLAVGKLIPWLWWTEGHDQTMLSLRILVFALGSWGIAYACWRYLEQPLDRFRQHARPA
ncbi:acyltransferase [Luteolibacter arcticus]|uniref:Acyltransferase n=1 Tax=Luteolibacter arcticus TaxID=1581411 RepID=A0ABT3GJP3_9BACT|nr:acyltransferase [Luteolibacter arcticus]MCW1923717.1 acyltransferase [Luteolibacter arcticus]